MTLIKEMFSYLKRRGRMSVLLLLVLLTRGWKEMWYVKKASDVFADVWIEEVPDRYPTRKEALCILHREHMLRSTQDRGFTHEEMRSTIRQTLKGGA